MNELARNRMVAGFVFNRKAVAHCGFLHRQA